MGDLVGNVAPIVARAKATQLARDALLVRRNLSVSSRFSRFPVLFTAIARLAVRSWLIRRKRCTFLPKISFASKMKHPILR